MEKTSSIRPDSQRFEGHGFDLAPWVFMPCLQTASTKFFNSRTTERSNKEGATALNISPYTAEIHCGDILQKPNLHYPTESRAMCRVRRHNLVIPPAYCA